MQAIPDHAPLDCCVSAAELTGGFASQLKLSVESVTEEAGDCRVELEENESHGEESDDEEEGEGEEFSFAFGGANSSPIAAEDAFFNGQIRPIFPLFDRDLLLSDEESQSLSERLPHVRKVFLEENAMPSENGEDSDAVGPYCEWSTEKKVAIDATPSTDACKKSNSTGFSKIWRFREFLHRSNSDGRDTFVFLNNAPPSSSSSSPTPSPPVETEKVVAVVQKKQTTSDSLVNGEAKKKKKGKGKTASLSAHEVYMRSKAQDEGRDRRRSYLPYRPGLVGFFTNVNGGLTRNVHPF